MLVSILHRATGVAMVVGAGLVVWMLLALASGPQAYDYFQSFVSSPIGCLMLLGWTVAIFLHLGNGVRHFFMDVGKGYEKTTARRSATSVLVFAIIMTLIVWCIACPWQP